MNADMVSNDLPGLVIVNSFETGGGAEVVYRSMVDRYSATHRVATVSGQYSPRERHAVVADKKARPLRGIAMTPLTATGTFISILRAIRSTGAKSVVVHNLWPNLGTEGATALWLAKWLWGTRIVLVAHDYQYVCATSMLYDHRRGTQCSDCLGRRLKLGPFRRRCDKAGAGVTFVKAARLLLGSVLLAKGRLFDSVVAPSETMRKVLLKEGYDSGSVVVALNGVAPPPSCPEPGDRRDIVLMAGRIEPEKGADIVPEICARILSSMPHARICILGDGSRREALAAAVERMGIHDRVEILGHVTRDTVMARAAEAKVYLFPSRWSENCPLGLVEAVLSGLEPVAEDLGGQAEILRGTNAGRLVASPGAARDYADACVASLRAYGEPMSGQRRSRARRAAADLYAEAAFYEAMDTVIGAGKAVGE